MTRPTIPDPAPMRISATGVWLRQLRRGEEPAGLRRGAPLLPRMLAAPPGPGPRYQQAEDEPADMGEERHAAPFAEALNSPTLATTSWFKNHSPRKIQAGIRTRKIGKMYMSIRESAGAVDGAWIERGVVDRGVEVRQLVEDAHGEVGHDQQDVDDREPSCGDAA